MDKLAGETPLTELLQLVPIELWASWPIQWSEDGFETGHAMAPIGLHCHRAASRIAALEKVAEAAVFVLSIDPLDDIQEEATLRETLRAAGYLKEQGE